MLWLWEKSKVSSQIKVGPSSNAIIYQCLFCPNESGLVSLVGKGLVRTLRTHDGILKAGPQPLAKREAQDYLCHTWLLDNDREKLLLGCSTGASRSALQYVRTVSRRNEMPRPELLNTIVEGYGRIDSVQLGDLCATSDALNQRQ
jgi:hypothetical protein